MRSSMGSSDRLWEVVWVAVFNRLWEVVWVSIDYEK